MKTLRLFLFITLTGLSITAWSLDLAPAKLPFSVTDLNFNSQQSSLSLSEYKGRKVMLWLFSTWCHTCVASVRAMQKQQTIWNKNGLVVLALRNYKNGGYPGVNMVDFMQKFAPQTARFDNWIIGEASEQMDARLNKKKFPDIYFLVDENGMVQAVDTAPNITMQKIIRFATGAKQ